MKACIQNVNVLDVHADALIYSTNLLLNCSGGVGKALMQRYGRQFQEDLHAIRSTADSRFAKRGDIIEHVTTGLPYQKVFHTIPSDGFYNTTTDIVRTILERCLQACADARTVNEVALSAIATGYGKLDFEEFFRVVTRVLNDTRFQSLARVTICIEDRYSYDMACDLIDKESLELEKAG